MTAGHYKESSIYYGQKLPSRLYLLTCLPPLWRAENDGSRALLGEEKGRAACDKPQLGGLHPLRRAMSDGSRILPAEALPSLPILDTRGQSNDTSFSSTYTPGGFWAVAVMEKGVVRGDGQSRTALA